MRFNTNVRQRAAMPSPSSDAQAYRRQKHSRSHAPRTPKRRRRTALTKRSYRKPIFAHVVFVLALAALVVLGVGRVRSCRRPTLSPDAANTAVARDDLHTSPYDWSYLSWSEDGRVRYSVDGNIVSRAGIDVSEHQEYIDWAAVAADGIDFAIVRVGYRAAKTGELYRDNYAEYNLRAAPEAGLDVGVYFYSEATTEEEAREEAEYVLSLIGGVELTYPVVFDHEPGNIEGERIASMTGEQRTQVARAFCNRIQEAGLTALVYGNATHLEELDLDLLADCGFWYADYSSYPSSSLRFALWQYSESGSVAGVDGYVDLDLDLTGVWAGEGA